MNVHIIDRRKDRGFAAAGSFYQHIGNAVMGQAWKQLPTKCDMTKDGEIISCEAIKGADVRVILEDINNEK